MTGRTPRHERRTWERTCKQTLQVPVLEYSSTYRQGGTRGRPSQSTVNCFNRGCSPVWPRRRRCEKYVLHRHYVLFHKGLFGLKKETVVIRKSQVACNACVALDWGPLPPPLGGFVPRPSRHDGQLSASWTTVSPWMSEPGKSTPSCPALYKCYDASHDHVRRRPRWNGYSLVTMLEARTATTCTCSRTTRRPVDVTRPYA